MGNYKIDENDPNTPVLLCKAKEYQLCNEKLKNKTFFFIYQTEQRNQLDLSESYQCCVDQQSQSLERTFVLTFSGFTNF